MQLGCRPSHALRAQAGAASLMLTNHLAAQCCNGLYRNISCKDSLAGGGQRKNSGCKTTLWHLRPKLLRLLRSWIPEPTLCKRFV